MNKFFAIIFATLCACATAAPGVVAPVAAAAFAAPLAYANAPLYAAGGSSQVDVRHNFDGTLSSYTTAPFDYTAPYSSRYVSGVPAAPAFYAAAAPAIAKYSAPLAAPLAHTAPLAAAYAAPYATPYASPYASPYVAATPYAAAPFAAAPFAAAPFAAAPFAAPALAAPAVAAPAPVVA